MRILMLSWEYPPHLVGGMGKHVMELAPALASAGFHVHVLTPRLRGGAEHEITAEGVRITRVDPPYTNGCDLPALARDANVALERAGFQLHHNGSRFDLIHVHDWLVADLGVALKHAWRRPLVATIHATERGRGRGQLAGSQAECINHIEWRLIYESWRVIACSQFMAHQLQQYFHAPADKIDVVPNAVHVRPGPFHSEAQRMAFRRRFVSDDQPLVYYVGRIVYEKGPQVLLEAWPQVRAAYPGARLLIAGTGDYLGALKARAWELGLGNEIMFTGYISDEERDRLYHIADVAALPSLYEPFGIAALEAMAARCPVVVAATGGLAEVVRLHETGLLVYPNNPDSLAWGILHTLAHPEWSRQRAENAYREVCDIYNWRTVVNKTGEVYRRTFSAWEQDSWGKEPVVHAHTSTNGSAATNGDAHPAYDEVLRAVALQAG